MFSNQGFEWFQQYIGVSKRLIGNFEAVQPVSSQEIQVFNHLIHQLVIGHVYVFTGVIIRVRIDFQQRGFRPIQFNHLAHLRAQLNPVSDSERTGCHVINKSNEALNKLSGGKDDRYHKSSN